MSSSFHTAQPPATDSAAAQAPASNQAAASAANHIARRPATFQLLYESRDGRLCLFQDETGHLTCVRSDRFA